MKSLAQINIARLAMLGTPEQKPDDERVLELFRNRSELKKAYSELQDEIHALKDRLKQQEGVTARVQEMLQDLETKLEVPETAYPALVFYSLKRLWNAGNGLLAKFAEELHRQQLEKESKAFFVESNRRRFARRSVLDAAVQEANNNCAAAEQRLAALEARRIGLAKPWHYFKRKDLEEQIAVASAAVRAARGDMEPAQLEFAKFEQENQEPFPGISIDAKRAINAAVIAYAELLCARLARTQLVGLAKAASLKRSSTENYGNRAECEALIEDVSRALAILGQCAPAGPEFKARAEQLRKAARYRAADDCIASAESVALPTVKSQPGQSRSRADALIPNIIAEDTWDIIKVLLR
jgi:hypothetical protein